MVLRNQKGMSLVGVIITAGIMSFMMLTMTNQMALINDMNKKQNLVGSLELLRSEVKAAILNESIWLDTINANNRMACLKNKNDSCNKNPSNFRLVSGSKDIVSTDATKGFNQNGEACEVDDKNPAACPIRLSLTWEPICSGSCNNPIVHVTGSFTYSGGRVFGGLRPERYNIDVIRERETEDFGENLKRELAELGCKNGQAIGLKNGKPSCVNIPTPSKSPARKPASTQGRWVAISSQTCPGYNKPKCPKSQGYSLNHPCSPKGAVRIGRRNCKRSSGGGRGFLSSWGGGVARSVCLQYSVSRAKCL